MNSTLTQYERLRSLEEAHLVGCALPQLTSGKVILQSQPIHYDALGPLLAEWQGAQGWHQLADSTAMGLPADPRTLLEGEWHANQRSLHIKLISPNTYQATLFSVDEASQQHCYRELALHTRSNLSQGTGDTFIHYRLWYTQNDGAWQPLAQQFIGFSQGGTLK